MPNSEIYKHDYFDFNSLYVGCPVLIAPDPQSKQEMYAIVSRVNPDSIDAMAIVGGRSAKLQPFADCWHVNDPRCTERPQVFRSPLRGVFKPAIPEISRISVLQRVADLEQLVKLLTEKVEQLEAN